jgi:hypothetical protein
MSVGPFLALLLWLPVLTADADAVSVVVSRDAAAYRKEHSAAKTATKASEYLPQRRKNRKEKNNILIRTWRSSRLGEKNIRSRDVSCIGKFAQAAQTVNDSSTKIG